MAFEREAGGMDACTSRRNANVARSSLLLPKIRKLDPGGSVVTHMAQAASAPNHLEPLAMCLIFGGAKPPDSLASPLCAHHADTLSATIKLPTSQKAKEANSNPKQHQMTNYA